MQLHYVFESYFTFLSSTAETRIRFPPRSNPSSSRKAVFPLSASTKVTNPVPEESPVIGSEMFLSPFGKPNLDNQSPTFNESTLFNPSKWLENLAKHFFR